MLPLFSGFLAPEVVTELALVLVAGVVAPRRLPCRMAMALLRTAMAVKLPLQSVLSLPGHWAAS